MGMNLKSGESLVGNGKMASTEDPRHALGAGRRGERAGEKEVPGWRVTQLRAQLKRMLVRAGQCRRYPLRRQSATLKRAQKIPDLEPDEGSL